MPTTRWFAVGSAGESEREAGLHAADEALIHDDAKLLIAFCSPSHDLPALVQQIRTRGSLKSVDYEEAGIRIDASVPPALAAEIETARRRR